VAYVRSLPVFAERAGYDIDSLIEDLIDNVKAHVTSNLVVVPILRTFNVLLEGDALSRLSDDPRGIKRPAFPQNLRMRYLIFSTQLTAITFNHNKERRSPQEHSESAGVHEDVRYCPLPLTLTLRPSVSPSVVHLLPFPPLFNICVPKLVEFLAHEFPSVTTSRLSV